MCGPIFCCLSSTKYFRHDLFEGHLKAQGFVFVPRLRPTNHCKHPTRFHTFVYAIMHGALQSGQSCQPERTEKGSGFESLLSPRAPLSPPPPANDDVPPISSTLIRMKIFPRVKRRALVARLRRRRRSMMSFVEGRLVRMALWQMTSCRKNWRKPRRKSGAFSDGFIVLSLASTDSSRSVMVSWDVNALVGGDHSQSGLIFSQPLPRPSNDRPVSSNHHANATM